MPRTSSKTPVTQKKVVTKKDKVPEKKTTKKKTEKEVVTKKPKIEFSLVDSCLASLLADCNGEDADLLIEERTLIRLIFDVLINGLTDNKVAKIYLSIAKERFRYDASSKTWYLINKSNIWRKDTDGSSVKQDILEKVSISVEEIYQKSKNFINECSEKKRCDGETSRGLVDRIMKGRTRINNYLGDNTRKARCLSELKGLCNHENVSAKFDNVNAYIIGFNNGVYDLKNNKFRLPKPKEMVSMSVGYNYVESKEMKTKLEKAMKILKKVLTSYFETIEDHDTIITEIAACLDANPSLEQFYYHSGVGANGKGVIALLIRNTFGDYQKSIKTDYITESKIQIAPNQADPTMAELPNVRVGLLYEAKSEMTLKSDIVKRITGQDPQVCRQLHGVNFTFTPVVRLFIQSNHDITIEDACSNSIKRRFKARKFPYTFVENPKEKYEKQSNENLKKELSKDIYKLAFFKYLLKYYNEFVSNGRKIHESANCKKETIRLLSINDPVGAFLSQYTIRTNNNITDRVKMTDLVNYFKKLNSEHPTANSMSIQKMKAILTSKNYRTVKTGYETCCGIKLLKDDIDRDINLAESGEPTKNEPEFDDEIENDGNYKLTLSSDEEEIPVVRAKKHSKKPTKIELNTDDEIGADDHINTKKQIKPIKHKSPRKKIVIEELESESEDELSELEDSYYSESDTDSFRNSDSEDDDSD